uniref:Uncharacterized protein n=1 Tax=Micrurus spixii TaxID=129469 RepID=A0A2D4M3I3_9SAUR
MEGGEGGREKEGMVEGRRRGRKEGGMKQGGKEGRKGGKEEKEGSPFNPMEKPASQETESAQGNSAMKLSRGGVLEGEAESRSGTSRAKDDRRSCRQVPGSWAKRFAAIPIKGQNSNRKRSRFCQSAPCLP